MAGASSSLLHDTLQALGEDAEKVTMTFGSDDFKFKLLSMLDSEEEAEELLRLLNIIVLKHTFNRVSIGFEEGEIYKKEGKKSKPLNTSSISDQDCYDIAGEVYCEVVKRLNGFIQNIIEKEYNEKARQAWLRKIIYCACARHLNKVGKFDYIIDSEEEENEITYIPVSDFKSPEYIAVCNDIIKNTITIACDAPFKPEKILSYLYNVMIFRELEGRKKNSSAKTSCEYMNDKILFVLKENFVPNFNKIYTVELSYDDIDSLSMVLGYNSATIKGKELFSATPKHVTDWSNRMKTYIYKYRNNLLAEEGNDEEYVK